MTVGWLAGSIRVEGSDGSPGGAPPASPPSRLDLLRGQAAGVSVPPDQSAAWSLFERLQAIVPGGSNGRARSQWYGSAYSRDDGALTVFYAGVGQARGTVQAVVRQSWFEQAPPDTDLGSLASGWRVSRLDLAADALAASGAARPADLYTRLDRARCRVHAANRVLIQNKAGGETLMLGSRTSERYLRAYVKDVRVRHELELKAAAAVGAWAALVAGAPAVAVWAAEYGRLVGWAA